MGANEGIGYHRIVVLLNDGYRVAALDVDGQHHRPLQEQSPDRIRFQQCDVTVDDDVETAIDAVVDRWGRIDILVNNAAIFEFGPSTSRHSTTRAASSR
jgi:NAD(P)-dependent dehydrogenase (short-subunit alcohol dehydrogenase family)